MHSTISGVSDFLAENEDDAIKMARKIVEINVNDKDKHYKDSNHH